MIPSLCYYIEIFGENSGHQPGAQCPIRRGYFPGCWSLPPVPSCSCCDDQTIILLPSLTSLTDYNGAVEYLLLQLWRHVKLWTYLLSYGCMYILTYSGLGSYFEGFRGKFCLEGDNLSFFAPCNLVRIYRAMFTDPLFSINCFETEGKIWDSCHCFQGSSALFSDPDQCNIPSQFLQFWSNKTKFVFTTKLSQL